MYPAEQVFVWRETFSPGVILFNMLYQSVWNC